MCLVVSSKKKILLAALIILPAVEGTSPANEIDPAQINWFDKYKTQQNIPAVDDMLINTDPEPDLTDGFKAMLNGKDLSGWTPKGGSCTFQLKDGVLEGQVVKGSPSTYLCTDKNDYRNFVFTCDMKWLVNSNSGVMFRAQTKPSNNSDVIFGPQAEMEGVAGDRGWSGGIYGQSCGGYFYPLWLKQHQSVRAATKKSDWNRITIQTKGNVVKTWLNGVPAAHWIDDGTYAQGFFGLQLHAGDAGTVLWRNIRVKELPHRQANRPKQNPAFAKVIDNPALPRVLLIGDSISIGYTVPVQEQLSGRANVHRIPTNGGPTTRGLASLDKWLGNSSWDVIHFNWGLHDLKYVDKKGTLVNVEHGQPQVSIETYESNLRKLVARLKLTKAKLIWRSTTPVPEGAKGRVAGDAARYNAVAASIMQECDIAIDDQYSFALPRLKAIQRPANVHFTAEGSRKLATQVVAAVTRQLNQ